MKKIIFFIYIFTFSLYLFNCNNSTESNSDLEFANMEIHYTKYGGWINTLKLDIYGNGLVNAYHIAHASTDILDSASTFLNQRDQERIAKLFSSFSKYNSRYEPDPWYTDGDDHIIIFIYESEADTVTVYEPENSNIPYGLRNIIQEMESLWQSTFD